jgi:hypothetical protein
MCKEMPRYLRHASFQVLGQQLQIIFVEENVEDEKRSYI